MKNEVEVKANHIYKRELYKKIIRIAFLVILILISIIYLVLYIVYDGGRFTVTLDRNLSNRKNVFLSESGKSSGKETKTKYTYTDFKGNVYPIYLSASGKAFTKKVSKKTGKEYRQYLPEIGKQINPEAYKEGKK
jgi:hypothetical protein